MNQQQRMDLLKKHAKNFAAVPKDSRPTLEGIYYDKKGRGLVTNTHVALIVEDVHQFQEPGIFHHKTGATIEGNYPDIDRAIPQECALTVELFADARPDAGMKRLKDLAHLHDLACRVSGLAYDGCRTVRYKIKDGAVRLVASDENCLFSASIPAGHTTKAELDIAFDARYMVYALDVLVAFKPATVSLGFTTKLGPFVFNTDVGVTIIMTPIRCA